MVERMIEKDLISIILPVFNKELTIEKCINSILKQSYSNYELIIINDGSTDNSLDKILKYKNFDNIKILNKSNEGVSKARNFGLKYANGRYVAFIDADDTIEKNYLEDLKRGYDTGADLSIIGFNEISGRQIVSRSSYNNEFTTNVKVLNHIFDFDGPLGYVWNKLWKVQIIKDHNIYFDENIKIAEDLLFNIQYLGYVKKVYINGAHEYNYFKDGSGLSKSFYIGKKDGQFVDDYLNYKSAANKILKKYHKIAKYSQDLEIKNAEANMVQINLSLLRNLRLNHIDKKALIKKVKEENLDYQNSYFTSNMSTSSKKAIFLLTMYLPRLMELIDSIHSSYLKK